ncbi:MAG: ribosomal protein L44E [Candidatus Woesearchaeota archaeon]|jgi:ribosomal protein L44E
MKLPKLIRRYNPVLRKHTEMKIIIAKKRTPGSSNPMGKFSKTRTDFGKGTGNLGRYGSRPPISKFKMTGKKRSKKTDIRFECQETKKQFVKRNTFRAKKVELI